MNIKSVYQFIVIFLTMFFVSGSLWAGPVISKVEDTSVALRVFNGYTGTVTAVVATNGEHIVVTCDGNATTLTAGSSYNTITLLAAGIEALTNAAGTASLTVDSNPSLLADSTDDELLDGTYTAVAGKWLELLWDTSACKFYSLYFPNRSDQTGVSPYVLEKVQGLPGGTGDLTLSVYQARTLIASKFVTSPVYVLPGTLIWGTAATNTMGTVNAVTVDWDLDIPFSGQDAVIVRAERDTAGTTGVLSGFIPRR